MRTIRVGEANRQFYRVLKQVSAGEEFLLVSRGKAVATISPVKKADTSQLVARHLLFERLRSQATSGIRTWTRNELYERS